MKLPPLLVYTVLRLLAFVVPLGILWLFPVFREYWWLAALFAALIGMSISFLFLRKPLSDASSDIHQRRSGQNRTSTAAEDAAAEDAATD